MAVSGNGAGQSGLTWSGGTETIETETTVYEWQGFTTYGAGKPATFSDDDHQLDWYGQDTGVAETLTIDGETHDVQWSGTIETRFEDSEGNDHTEDLVYTYT